MGGEGSRSRRWLRRLLVAAAAGALLVPVAAVGSVVWLRASARGHLYDAEAVPPAPVALVLGAKVNPDGTPSAFLTARLELAKRLYDTGKVRALLVSGDHARWEYDEPGAMRRWLVAHGVPAEKVVLDHAGFDTYDSCLRARRVFGVERTIVVTQTFHLARAVTLCRHVGLDAVGVGDDSVSRFERSWARGEIREYGAAVKALVDVVTRRDPVFLGPREPALDDALR
ncbi:protein SanA, affects membrane permeability for vancomycin [Micromonospora pattaloongensis]|uniref:Protein SanA, affects membrane permeability for vancomycin n=1 Tax=Micromonospora pattaloongensis TaxID=405436 RepID=A0A1H3P2N4_9ACTN|nr:ElyC/SanA/YdcF family protein [Micromonospora pattaloongensis]SDY95280.1 protein SanA, affects membrane permeability for vancomycin [Micromonospora pattaloongensis]